MRSSGSRVAVNSSSRDGGNGTRLSSSLTVSSRMRGISARVSSRSTRA
ncbi:hypothetical protein [Streptomyces sp. S4.7]|nr:hypothetical protein [Streptomyces sp. S4.7]